MGFLRTTIASIMAAATLANVSTAAEAPKPFGAIPTPQQVDWLRLELYGFVHFGLNTYTNREWGYGNESPALFNPAHFDADAIVSTFKQAGLTGLIYTAKHHDGWCAWPTKSTENSVRHSPWKNGQGDVVREFANACQKHGMNFGTYLSPWDRNCAEYGKPGYLKKYYEQIRELLTQYGPIFEIWFDGAMGGDGYYGGAQEPRSIGSADTYYNFKKVVELIRSIQPDCIIWGAENRGDARWGGSEQGFVPYPSANILHKNTPQERWVIMEGDTPINRAGWFWHPGQASKVKSPQHMLQVYLDSVGRGANLIINVAPNRDGQLDPADVKSLLLFGKARQEMINNDMAKGAAATAGEVRGNDAQFAASAVTDGDIESYWCPNDGTTTGSIELQLAKPVTFDVVRIREQIRLGARVEGFEIDAWINGAWQTIDNKGKTIENQVLRKLNSPITTDRVRVRITEARACPCISEISLLKIPHIDYQEPPAPKRTAHDSRPWKTIPESAKGALDSDISTIWKADKAPSSFIVDMKRRTSVASFAYLPRQDGETRGMIDRFKLESSEDGEQWCYVTDGEFGNLRANPIEQEIDFPATRARFLRFTAESVLEGTEAILPRIKFYDYH